MSRAARPPVDAGRAEHVVERRGRKRPADRPRGDVARRRPARRRPGCDTPPRRTRTPGRGTSGPPAAAANCWRSNGGSSPERAIVGGRQPLPAAVAQEERRRAAQLVGARLGHDVDRRRCRAPRFRREAVGGDLELLHRLLRDVLQRPADDVVVVVGAVDHDVAAAPELTGRRDRDGVRLGRVEVRRRRVARHEQRQLEEVAAVERQRLDQLCRDDRIDHRTARVDRRPRRRPRRRRPSRAPAERAARRRATRSGRLRSRTPVRRASPNPGAVTVMSTVAGGHVGDHERTVRVGRRATRERRPARHHLDDRRRDWATLRVANGSADRSGGCLTSGLARERHHGKRDAHSNTTDTNHVPTPGWTDGRPVSV